MKKIYNFSAGPAMLHSSVLEAVSKASKDYEGHGLSLLEMSHRSKPVQDMIQAAEDDVRALAGIPENYHILFLQGGASLQFSMVPMNLLTPGGKADHLITGSFANLAFSQVVAGWAIPLNRSCRRNMIGCYGIT